MKLNAQAAAEVGVEKAEQATEGTDGEKALAISAAKREVDAAGNVELEVDHLAAILIMIAIPTIFNGTILNIYWLTVYASFVNELDSDK
jgi:hypothetical protein